MAGRSYPTALSNISLSILISYKCVEVIFPRMESVAVISLVYKVQMSKPMQLLRQCFSTLYLHDGDLWHSIIHGCLNKPKCSLSLRALSQPRCVLPTSLQGCWQVEHGMELLWPLCPAGTRWRPGIPAPPALLSLGGGGKRQPLHFLHVTATPLLMERSLLGSESLHFSPAGTRLVFLSHFPLFLLQLGDSLHRNWDLWKSALWILSFGFLFEYSLMIYES